MNKLWTQIGALDPSFSGDGIVHSSLGPSGSTGLCAALQPDGKILFGGNAFFNNTNHFAIGRLLPNGTYDNTFSGDGRLTFGLNSSVDGVHALHATPDGKIIAFGWSKIFNPSSYVFALVQFNNDGTVDSTFGVNGVVKSRFTGQDSPTAMAVQPDGKILAAGNSMQDNQDAFIIARYLPNGQLDTTFNIHGYIEDRLDQFNLRLFDMVLQPDGKIVAAGYLLHPENNNDTDYILRRYNPNGTLDTTFGLTGIVRGDFYPNSKSEGSALALQADGKLVLVGVGAYPNGTVATRFLENGMLDLSFGAAGVTIVNKVGWSLSPSAVAVAEDGKILIAGGIVNQNFTESDVMLARLQSNGVVDTSFGNAGIQQASIVNGVNNYEYANDLVIQADGKIILVGSADGRSLVTRHLTELHVGLLDFNQFEAIRVYPNPIQSSAVLNYELREPTELSVMLFDSYGQQLATYLSAAEQPAGKHDLSFTLPAHLTSGLYLLVLSNGQSRTTIKIIKQ